MAALVLYSCGGEVYSIWSSLASQALQTLSRVVHNLPLKIKKCLGIVLDNRVGTVELLTNALGPHGTTARRELHILISSRSTFMWRV